MIIKSSKNFQDNAEVGSKAKRLQELQNWGYKVPEFVIVPASDLERAINSNGNIDSAVLDELQQDIIESLPTESFAVRSSALVEDSEAQSYAGQFHTELDVDPKSLTKALEAVIKQAFDYLDSDISKFSIIVQEFIEPDIAGVVFTRSPHGGREIVLEYSAGRGEAVVSGQVKPEQLRFYWHESPDFNKIPRFGEVISQMKDIESHYSFPQDVEWCLKGSDFYFLQSRPISSISPEQFTQIQFLEEKFKDQATYFLQKTEISEIAPRPSVVTLELLKFIYSDDGPVSKVYSDFGVKYKYTNFLSLIGNELYINKEAELKSFFPAQSLLTHKTFEPNFASFKGMMTTMKNQAAFGRIRSEQFEDLFVSLSKKFDSVPQTASLQEFLNSFFLDYQLVFKMNLYSGRELAVLKHSLKQTPKISLSEILSSAESLFEDLASLSVNIDQGSLVGNTIDIQDETPFVMQDTKAKSSSKEISSWFKKLTSNAQEQVKQSLGFAKLREIGRWLVVLRINQLRELLFSIAEENSFKNVRDIYFSSINELVKGKPNEQKASMRQASYREFNQFTFPTSITHTIIKEDETATRGVSAGVARGRLTDLKGLSGNKTEPVILYSPILSPDLVGQFDKVTGIISENGGELSHLAIMARENNIPVVTGVSPIEIKIGDLVEIDGSSGEIKTLS